MKNAFTIDVEDYFQVESFASVVDRQTWSSYRSRVERNTHLILDMLDESQVQGTFFVLGWVARHYPDLIREVAGRGHEEEHGNGEERVGA